MRSLFRHIPFALLILTLQVSSATAQEIEQQISTATNKVGSVEVAKILRAKDLAEDAALLHKSVELLHPGLLRYNTSDQIEAAFDKLKLEFQQDRTLSETFLAFSALTAQIKCGHSYPNFFNQSPAISEQLFHGWRLPFYFRWIDNRMIVTKSFTADHPIQAGTEILTINSIPVATILSRLMTVARADGNNNAKRIANMEVNGSSELEAFDIYWPLLFPSTSNAANLTLRRFANLKTQQITVPMMDYPARISAIRQVEKSSEENRPIWTFRHLNKHVGYLKMPSWALYNSKWDWRQFLDTTIADLAANKTSDLIIDLRGNEGGDDIGNAIASHFISSPIKNDHEDILVRYRRVPEDLDPYLDAWNPQFRDWGDSAIPLNDHFYRLQREDENASDQIISPTSPQFKGKLWVLVDANNSSATFDFAQLVKRYRIGTLVGQSTGGNQRGINGGALFFLRLPHSGIEIDLPLIGRFPHGNLPDAGLAPDIFIKPNIRDINKGRDTELNFVLNQIGKN